MFGYIIKRLIYIVGIVIVMSVVVFAITQIMPGNVAYMILGDNATTEEILYLEDKLGLNDPIYVQYWRWASAALRGDLGESLVMERPIAPVLWQAIVRSAILASISITLVAIIGIWLGVVSALKHGTSVDHVISITTYFFLAVPEFLWAIVVIMLFAGYLGWFPATGYTNLDAGFWNWAKHLVLPVLTLVVGLVAHVSRLTRSSMLEVMNSQYVLAARAKGVPERLVVQRHALRNGLLPTVTVLAIDVGVLMGGIVVVETIFSFPGLGRLMLFGINQLDLPLIQACMIVITVIYAGANLVADLTYAYLNPRIRYGN